MLVLRNYNLIKGSGPPYEYFTPLEEPITCDFCYHGGRKRQHKILWTLLMHMASHHRNENYHPIIQAELEKIRVTRKGGPFQTDPLSSPNDQRLVQ